MAWPWKPHPNKVNSLENLPPWNSMQFADILKEDKQSKYLYLSAVWLVRESTSTNCFLSLYMG